jgi:hypothetical protein
LSAASAVIAVPKAPAIAAAPRVRRASRLDGCITLIAHLFRSENKEPALACHLRDSHHFTGMAKNLYLDRSHG